MIMLQTERVASIHGEECYLETEQRLFQADMSEWPFPLVMAFAMVPIHPSCSDQDVFPFSSLEPWSACGRTWKD